MTIYTATLRDYTFGCDEEWEWTGVPSFGHGAYRTPRAELAGRHGNAPRGGDWGTAGLLSWPLELLMPADPAEAEAATMRLRAAFAPQTDNELVEMSIVMHSGTFVVRGRPLRPEVVTNELGVGNGLVQF